MECPNPAYDRLIKSGLADKIISRKEEIHNTLLYKTPFYEPRGSAIFDWANRVLENEGKISERRESARDISELERKFTEADGKSHVDGNEFAEMLLQNPSWFARFMIGKEVLRFAKHGFPTRKSLEESVVSFCVGEQETYDKSSDSYVWRNGRWKNTINLNMHGDLYVEQKDVSGVKRIERRLFGKEIYFDTHKKVEGESFGAHQDWSAFLVSVLRYSKLVGKSRIPEIVNWEGVLQKVGEKGTNTAECMFGSGGLDNIPWLITAPLAIEGGEENAPAIQIWRSHETQYIPYFSDGRLIYLKPDNEGEINLLGKRYSQGVEFNENDLTHLLKANYRFFARDKSQMRRIMKIFNIAEAEGWDLDNFREIVNKCRQLEGKEFIF